MKQIKVLYDYQAFHQKVGGVSRCFCEIAKHIPQNIKIEFGVCCSDNIYLKDPLLIPDLPSCKLNRDKFLFTFKFRGKNRLYDFLNNNIPLFPSFENINKRYSQDIIKEGNFDILHLTMYDDYFIPYIGNKPIVITVHDMIWELRPCKINSDWSAQKKRMCYKANHIIAVSENTKSDLINLWKIPEDKITVIYHGSPNLYRNYIETPIINKPYFLYVGRRHTYKNFRQTLYDFAQFSKMHPEVFLVCTGESFSITELQLFKKFNVYDKVFHKFATEEELANLYKHAIAFIFPSVYEGFGIPILEAFSYGCLTMLNNKSCFPEIGGNAAIYFNSDENASSNLVEKMEYVYNIPNDEKNKYIEEGYKRMELFKWQESAKKIAELYESLM